MKSALDNPKVIADYMEKDVAEGRVVKGVELQPLGLEQSQSQGTREAGDS